MSYGSRWPASTTPGLTVALATSGGITTATFAGLTSFAAEDVIVGDRLEVSGYSAEIASLSGSTAVLEIPYGPGTLTATTAFYVRRVSPSRLSAVYSAQTVAAIRADWSRLVAIGFPFGVDAIVTALPTTGLADGQRYLLLSPGSPANHVAIRSAGDWTYVPPPDYALLLDKAGNTIRQWSGSAWLPAAQGPQGVPGANGATGAQGVPGIQGPPGAIPPHIIQSAQAVQSTNAI